MVVLEKTATEDELCAMVGDATALLVRSETKVTKKVIAAIPDAASSYKPDPNARSAKELAWKQFFMELSKRSKSVNFEQLSAT